MDRFFYLLAAALVMLGLSFAVKPVEKGLSVQPAFFSLLFPQLIPEIDLFATPGEAQAGEAVFL